MMVPVRNLTASSPVIRRFVRSARSSIPRLLLHAMKRPSPCSILFGLLAAGCASPRPVLYPNPAYERAGPVRAEQEIQLCMEQARAYLGRSPGSAESRLGVVAGETARGAAAGAAVGAVAGAVSGEAARGAKIGAATGGTGEFLRGLFGSTRPHRLDPIYVNFVERCLRDKGYEPIGWR